MFTKKHQEPLKHEVFFYIIFPCQKNFMSLVEVLVGVPGWFPEPGVVLSGFRAVDGKTHS